MNTSINSDMDTNTTDDQFSSIDNTEVDIPYEETIEEPLDDPKVLEFLALHFESLTIDERRAAINAVLKPGQHEGFWNQVRIVEEWGVVFHVSQGGSGKTIMVLLMAKWFNLPVCPFTKPTPMGTWDLECKRWKVNIHFQMTVDTLKGKKKCNHGLLTRTENGDYEPTAELDKLFSTKCIVTLDEIHYGKNKDTLLHKALCTITHKAREKGCPIVLMSGTPACQKHEAEAYIRIIGACGIGELITFDDRSRTFVPKAITPLIHFCNNIDPNQTALIVKHRITPTTLTEILFRLYTTVIAPAINVKVEVKMPPINYKAVFCHLEGEAFAEANAASKSFNSSVGIARNRGDGKKQIYAAQNKYDRITEPIKCRHVIADRLIADAQRNPKMKFAIYLKFHESMEILRDRLESVFPGQVVMMNAATHPKEKSRSIVFSKYNEPNDDLKILISSRDVAGVSVSMGDPVGDRPRKVYSVPDSSPDRQIQSYWRTCRATSKSPTDVEDIFLANIPAEEAKYKKNEVKKQRMGLYTVAGRAPKSPGTLPRGPAIKNNLFSGELPIVLSTAR